MTISSSDADKVEGLLLEGWSAYCIKTLTGVSRNVIKRLLSSLEARRGHELMCRCGKSVRHIGDCSSRVEQRAILARRLQGDSTAALVPTATPVAPPPLKPAPVPYQALPRPHAPAKRHPCGQTWCEMTLTDAKVVGAYVIESYVCACTRSRTETRTRPAGEMAQPVRP